MLDRLIKLTSNAFLFLLPLYFLPLERLNVDSDKQFLLFFFTAILLILTLLKFLLQKKITLFLPFHHPPSILHLLSILTLFFLLSSLFVAPNRVTSLFSPFGAGTFLALLLLYIVMIQNINLYKLSLRPLIYGGAVSSILVILSLSKDLNLYPLGEPLFAAAFLVVLTALLFGNLNFKNWNLFGIWNLRFGILLLLFLSALTVTTYRLFTNWPLFLPLQFGWSVLLEMYKNLPNFLLGVGPGNFIYAWTSGKPVAVNSTPFWNIIATYSSNFPLHLATEAGILSVLVFFWIVIKSLITPPNSPSDNSPSPPLTVREGWGALRGVTALFLLLLPPNVLLLTLFIILLAFNTTQISKHYITPPNSPSDNSPSPPLTVREGWGALRGVTIIFFLFALFFIYINIRYYAANLYHRLAISAANQGNIQQAYDLAETAVSVNPASDNYALTASSLNLALARNFPPPQATESASPALSYIQRSVFLAKKAVALNPKNSENWSALSTVYQSLIGSVENSESAALEALNNQILLDPNSPQPRLTAGGFLMSMNFYDRAEDLMKQAVSVKPDWNNAHYNLAVLYSRTGKYQLSQTELQTALQLTQPDTPDYKTLQSEMGNLQNLMNEAASPSASQAPSVTNENSKSQITNSK